MTQDPLSVPMVMPVLSRVQRKSLAAAIPAGVVQVVACAVHGSRLTERGGADLIHQRSALCASACIRSADPRSVPAEHRLPE